MLDSKNLRENIDTISSNLKKRKFILDKSKFLSIDKDRKEIIVDTENLKNKRKTRPVPRFFVF